MNTGTYISGAAHLGLLGTLLLSGVFAQPIDKKPRQTVEVTIVTPREFAALMAPPVVLPQTPTVPPPSVAPEIKAPAAVVIKPPVSAPPVPTPPVPKIAPAPARITPQTPDQPSVLIPPPLPAADQTGAVKAPPSKTPTPRAAPRVAPIPSAPTPPDVRPADSVAPASTPDATVKTPLPKVDATAPPAATTRIVTEADKPASSAPKRSIRPPKRPKRPKPAVQTATTKPAPSPAPPPAGQTVSATEARAAAIAAAVKNAIPAPKPAPVPVGPPLSRGEKDALRVAVSRCWNVGTMSSAALRTTVVVEFELTRDGRVVANTLHMVSASAGSPQAVAKAYGAARRAILRCGAKGYSLPADKYERWRNTEITFDPVKMRIK